MECSWILTFVATSTHSTAAVSTHDLRGYRVCLGLVATRKCMNIYDVFHPKMPCSTIDKPNGSTDGSTITMVHADDAVSAAECEGEKSTDANEAVIDPKKITDRILALKAAAVWPEEAGTPAFNDEAATVYLNIVSKTKFNRFWLNNVGIMTLPYPLSLDRRVCYISNEVETEEQQAVMTEKLKEAGVLGKIKIVPKSLLRLAIETDDQEALAELPKLYDSYFRSRRVFNQPMLKELLAKERKYAIQAAKSNLKKALSASFFWVNSENDGYIVKVGHTGHTDEQLQQNIVAAFDFINGNELFFPHGIGSVRSVQLKTGTSEAVSMHQDDSAEVTSLKSTKLHTRGLPASSAGVIAEAVSLITTAADWPKEETVPAFTDEAAIVYLDVLPKRKALPADTYFGVLRLPHPLSLNRRVCYIGKDVETEKQQDEMTQKLKEAGVLGKIKMIPGSLVEMAAENGEEEAITQLVRLYDTHFVEKQVRKSLHWKKLQPAFLTNEKYALHAVPSDFGNSLKKSSIWINSSNNGFVVKVGHSGHSEEQLQQNIVAAVSFFKRWDVFFPKEIASMKSVQLRPGTGKGISIFRDGFFKVEPVVGDKKPSEDPKKPLASRKKRGGVKLKRPAEAKTGDHPVPVKRSREC